MYGGRWNSVGNPLLYATEHISLAVLEVLVNKRTNELYQTSFYLRHMEISAEDVRTVATRELKNKWQMDIDYTRYIGDHFLQDPAVWILKVPSAVIAEEHNFLINPMHPDFKKLKTIQNLPYNFDYRILSR